jgi:predicted nuclease of predicted toxin-antitoxin system
MIWLDAQLSPTIGLWLSKDLNLKIVSALDLNLLDAPDLEIFQKAKSANAILITKDRDFVELLYRFGSPPKIIWITCGNTSKRILTEILRKNLEIALEKLENGVDLVEIS